MCHIVYGLAEAGSTVEPDGAVSPRRRPPRGPAAATFAREHGARRDLAREFWSQARPTIGSHVGGGGRAAASGRRRLFSIAGFPFAAECT